MQTFKFILAWVVAPLIVGYGEVYHNSFSVGLGFAMTALILAYTFGREMRK